MSVTKISFDVHPSVIFQLGADLISDDVQALIELIKNSYDANAAYAHVQIDTQDSPQAQFPETLYPNAQGFIRITDDGEGMNLDSIRNGWFVVSNSAKRQAKTIGKDFKRKKNSSRRQRVGPSGVSASGEKRGADFSGTVKSWNGTCGFSWAISRNTSRLTDVPIKGPI